MTGDRPTVLVAEDTLADQVVAARMLERCGYRAQIAENGLDALDALSQGTFAAVLMDSQMPALNGYETAQEIRRRESGGPRMPIIGMTASSMQGERERCLAAGMDDHLAKPLRQQLLEAALTRWARAT
jgi:CheY-like chemotaxis protein